MNTFMTPGLFSIWTDLTSFVLPLCNRKKGELSMICFESG